MIRFSATMACVFGLVLSFCHAAALGQTNSFETAFRSGTEAMRSGDLEAAADDFSQAAKLNPSFAEAHLNLGLVRIQQARYDDAIAALDKSISIKPRLRGAN